MNYKIKIILDNEGENRGANFLGELSMKLLGNSRILMSRKKNSNQRIFLPQEKRKRHWGMGRVNLLKDSTVAKTFVFYFRSRI